MIVAGVRRVPTAVLTAGLLFVVAVVATGCGGSSAPAPHVSGPAYEVAASNVSNLGSVLVDGQGFTLYLFEPDHQSGRSSCSGPCAVEWSPLTLPSGVTTPVAGSGVEASKLSTTRRSDGTTQVTYNGWPLYTWAQDTAPGQATGEGLDNLGGLWYALNTAGDAVIRPRA